MRARSLPASVDIGLGMQSQISWEKSSVTIRPQGEISTIRAPNNLLGSADRDFEPARDRPDGRWRKAYGGNVRASATRPSRPEKPRTACHDARDVGAHDCPRDGGNGARRT